MRECIVDDKTLEQLEFPKVKEAVSTYCRGDGGRVAIQQRVFVTDVDELQSDLLTVMDYCTMISEQVAPALDEYHSIEEDLFYLSKEGYVLSAESVLRMLYVLLNYEGFVNSFSKNAIKEYPHLHAAGYVKEYDQTPVSMIKRVFDEEGKVKPNASPELARVIKRMESVSRELDREFDQILASYKKQNLLTDHPESWKNGRRVLVIPVENKRKISGSIHDQSASGKTLYIEPEGVMRINNELQSLENEKRAEVYRILKDLSDQLRTHRGLIAMIYDKIAHIDSLRAKALFSMSIDGVMPELSKYASLELIEVRHPLLSLQLRQSGQEAVSFDLDMHGQNRLLLISGPNAGGKSVTLKAVGLVHLMTYFGLLVPVSDRSVIGMFKSIHTDIGDQQSIDEGLSTYSSHLTNLNNIVKEAGKHSLVLLDEIGSGTDPNLGGAIAEGILKALLAKRVHGIVTTHYSSLKVYAFRTKGIVNGAMLFDKENLQPTYRLKVGKPGSSYAFEVAKKIGLDDRIIGYARKKVGKKENEVEDLLVDLQDGRAILEEQLEYVANEKRSLERLIKTYESLNQEFQIKKKKLQIQAKEATIINSSREDQELQDLINKLQKEKDLEKAKKLKEEAKQKRKEEAEKVLELKRDVSESRSDGAPVTVGCTTRVLDSDLTGEVLTVNGGKAEVLVGLMKMWVPLVDLVVIDDPLKIHKRGVNVKGVAFENNFSPKLDIRGYKMQDAADTLEVFFDKALLSNVKTLEIVHGKGSGALRKLVLRKMKEYRDLESYYHADDDRGGDGVTFITL